MSLIRPNHKMHYVKGISSGYVFLSGENGAEGMTDWGCSNAELVEIFAGILYSITSKEGDEPGKDMWLGETEWLVQQLARRFHISLEPKPLTYEEADKLENIAHNTQHWRDHLREAAKDDWTVYQECKEMWDYRVSKKDSGINDWMVEHYGTFENTLIADMKKRDAARKFVEKHWHDWREIEVPIWLDDEGNEKQFGITIDQLKEEIK